MSFKIGEDVRRPVQKVRIQVALWPRPRVAALIAALLMAVLPAAAGAKVFHARDEALLLAFPDADRTEARNFFLTSEQRQAIQERARAALETNLVTVYVGYRGGQRVGYAILDTHIVRTLPETFLVVLTPEGEVASTHVLAFYEPLEYLPGDRWVAQFDGKRLDDDLSVGRGIAAITGSTLTSRAVTDGIRRALGIYAVLLGEK
jgi:Na+-translocating ferredoxin:NAD+ oxidoreductase RnfG subunit